MTTHGRTNSKAKKGKQTQQVIGDDLCRIDLGSWRWACQIRNRNNEWEMRDLSPGNWEMLKLLLTNPGKVVTYAEMAQVRRGDSTIDIRTMAHWHMSHLRQMMVRISGHEGVKNVYTRGYRWEGVPKKQKETQQEQGK